MPNSVFIFAISVFLISLLMSLATMVINRRLAGQEKFAEWQEEISRWNAEKERAKKTNDKKLHAKLRKQEKRIQQMQSKILKGQMLSTTVNMGLFIGVWQVLPFLFGDNIVAYVPFAIPFAQGSLPYALSLFPWYIICSFFSSALLSRIFGVSLGMGTRPQTTR